MSSCGVLFYFDNKTIWKDRTQTIILSSGAIQLKNFEISTLFYFTGGLFTCWRSLVFIFGSS